MNKEEKEFDIDNITKLDGEYLITGACNKGCIGIGDIFLIASQNIIKISFAEGRYEFQDLQPPDIREVKLQVIRIKAHNHDMDELYQGMSGELYLKGEGGDFLIGKDYLRVKDVSYSCRLIIPLF